MESGLRHLAMISQFFLQSLFPIYCLRCGQEQTLFCKHCHNLYLPKPCLGSCFFCDKNQTFGYTCLSCQKSTFLDGCISLGFYGDPVLRQAIHGWKYQGQREFELYFFDWIERTYLLDHLPSYCWSVQPIPLHIRRQNERGFNQAYIMAQWIAEKCRFTLVDLLNRTVFTPAQAARIGSGRFLGELDGIFSVKPGIIPSHILLCDDVFTSGATMDSAAKIFKQAGAKMVWGLTLAKG